uniref:Uncharacterized protein n=1 Tax=Oryzias melastigma TaxID=30732 RepID=A0A3B3BQY5_ORYME
MEVIISAAETGFTGSLVGSSALTRPAAYMGTMTGCFFCPVKSWEGQTALLQWDPPHWYLRPSASCTSRSRSAPSSCVPGPGSGLGSAVSSRSVRTSTCCSSSCAAAAGKQLRNRASSRLDAGACTET